MKQLLACIIASVLAAPLLRAQSPTFEAVSIKAYAGPVPPQVKNLALVIPATGGIVRGSPTTALPLITQAYRTSVFAEIIGPDWIRTTRFEFLARVASGVSRDELLEEAPAMMRAMLEDRFKFEAHVETRTMPVYALVKARADGRLGAKLHESSPIDCDAQAKADIDTQKQMSDSDFIAMKKRLGLGRCSTSSGPGQLVGHDVTMKSVAGALGVDRPVVDRTGLESRFDVDLHWSPPAAPSPDGSGPISDGPSVFTALQKQRGLKLDARQEPMEVLVIDHIEPPTPN